MARRVTEGGDPYGCTTYTVGTNLRTVRKYRHEQWVIGDTGPYRQVSYLQLSTNIIL